jgi:hypothetical protein
MSEHYSRIQIDPHTLERTEERGATAAQIIDVIQTGFPFPAKHGRLGKYKIYPFATKRGSRFYEQRRVEVFYTIEGDVLVTV